MSMWPLGICKQGERVVIREIAGGMGIKRRLEAMGLYPGEEVEVVSANGGPIILNVKGCRVGIGRGMAFKILVSNNGSERRME
jgi:Fe2+ transport system protein FeoA